MNPAPPTPAPRPRAKTAALLAALAGFAANSLLARAALGAQRIDAWSFTFVRLAGGALVLALLARAVRARAAPARPPADGVRAPGSWASALALFAYAALFSLAYLRLPTGVGALVLFACVQATMIGWGIRGGERPTALEWTGLALALGGLALLAAPALTAARTADALGLASMALAGVAWGVYSLRGRSSRAPLATTAANFARAVPLAAVGLAAGWSQATARPAGVALALASGALASGLGYSLWYLALPALSATRAAIVQLSVPALAAAAGVALLGEAIDARLAGSAALILGGVALAVVVRGARSRSPAARRAA